MTTNQISQITFESYQEAQNWVTSRVKELKMSKNQYCSTPEFGNFILPELNRLRELSEARADFAFESTLSGLAYLKKIQLWQTHGYQVKLWFLSLPNEEIAISRVARRVLQGGHNIPEEVIRRRFKAGLKNFQRDSIVVNSWAFYDSYHRPPKLIDWSNK
jgi:predicted ABC-type ATPase